MYYRKHLGKISVRQKSIHQKSLVVETTAFYSAKSRQDSSLASLSSRGDPEFTYISFEKQVSDDDDHEDSSEESESEEEEDEVMSSSHRHSIRAANPNPKQEKSRSGSPTPRNR